MSANQTNIQLQNTTLPTSPSQFLDQAIALETLKLMEKTLGGGKWTWAVAGTVFFILSIDGVKRVIFNIVDKSITYLCNMSMEDWSNVGSAVVTPIKLVGRGVSLPFRYIHRKISPEKKIEHPTPPVMYPLDCSEELWKMLYTRPEFSFDTSVVSIKHIGNGSEIQQVERWSNMRLSTESFTVYFEGNLDITFTIKSSTSGNLVKLFSKSKTSDVQDESLFSYDEKIAKLQVENRTELSNPYGNKRPELYNLTLINGGCIHVYKYTALTCVPNKFDGIMYNAISFFRHTVYSSVEKGETYYFNVNKIKGRYDEKILDVSYLYKEAYLLINIMKDYSLTNCYDITYYYMYISILYACIGDNIELYQYINSMPSLRFYGGNIITLKYRLRDNGSELHSALKDMKIIADQTIFNGIPSALVHEFKRWFLMFTGVITPNNSPKLGLQPEETKSSSSKSIFFYIHSSLQQPLQHFTGWLSKISTEDSADKKDIDSLKIKANYIKIEKRKETKKVKNPEYDNWFSVAQKLGLLKDSSSEEKQPSQMVIQTNILDKMPPEFLTETKEITEVKCEHINNVYKGIHTLYLQTSDYRKLFTSLDNFKNRKALLQELGFPLKLGILLHGLPGTGKSATILAIASYLQKDIFFVDLRSVKTNGDLKMIFDHILTMNLNGGILVFEDIDCATKTVLQRDEFDEIGECNTTSVLAENDSEFTLDYFLNILQGTLTRDNTIFIMTTNYVNKLDSALIRDGRIDVNIEMKLTNKEQISQMWKSIFKRDVSEGVLKKFKEYTFKPASILSRCAEYLTCGEDIDDEEILKPFLL